MYFILQLQEMVDQGGMVATLEAETSGELEVLMVGSDSLYA